MRLIGRRAIALVVITHNQEYLADSASMALIKDEWIKDITIGAFTPNPADTLKYGKNAINGVNRYVINDERYPKVYLKFVNAMKKVETPAPAKKER